MTPAERGLPGSVRRGLLLLGPAAALGALAAGQKPLALGLCLGALGSFAYFTSLWGLSGKLLGREGKGPGFFWPLHLLRLALFLGAAWAFWRISPSCFLGAMISHVLCLALLLAASRRGTGLGEKS